MKELIKIGIVEKLLGKIEIVSGKVFLKETKKEIKNLKNYICQEFLKRGNVILDNDLSSIINTLYNYSSDGLWYELPLVKKAKEMGAIKSALPFDLDDKQLLIINRMLFHPQDEVYFIVTGVGGSGKSTFLNIVKQLFDNDFSSCSLSDLSNGFNVAEAVKHRLICSDELAKGELNLPILKILASKQQLFVNPKNQTGYEVRTQSAILYSCNTAPRMDATDSGVLRRTVFYERNTKIKNPDVTLKDKVYTEDELLCILRNALRFENDLWYNVFEEETHKYIMKGNTVYMFIGCSAYESYVDCCRTSGLRAFSEPNWRELRELFTKWCKEDALKYGGDNEELPY